MSGAQPIVGASSGSSAPAPSQQHEITAGQLSDAIREIIRQQQQQQQEIKAVTPSRSDDELRGWLMFITTLTASITYSAALNPPGGVWQADDPAKGYLAGRPVFRDKFRVQYLAFYYCNLTSFAMSLFIIVLLSTPSFYNRIQRSTFSSFVTLDILAWAGAFIAGSSTSLQSIAYEVGVMLAVLAYMAFHIFVQRITTRHTDQSV